MPDKNAPDFIHKLVELEPKLTPYSKKSYIDHSSRWYYRETFKFMNRMVPKDVKILDMGCGYGTFGIDLMRRGYVNYHGIDRDAARVKLARELYKTFRYPPGRITHRNIVDMVGKWDVLISMEVLYMLKSNLLQHVFYRAQKCLNPGGYLIFTHMISEQDRKPNRSYLELYEVSKMLRAAGFEIVAVMPRPWPGGAHRNQWIVAQRITSPPRQLLVTVDGDGFFEHGQAFKEKVLEQYPFKFSVSMIANVLANRRDRDELAADIFRMANVEVVSHSFSHPQNWEDMSPERLEQETQGSIKFLNNFLAEHRIPKTVSTLFWSGMCNPTEKAIALLDEMGVGNFNGKGWSTRPFIMVGDRIWYPQRGFHDTWWFNRNKGQPWGDHAIDFYRLHADRPIHLYFHFTAVAPERWPSTKRILDWAQAMIQEERVELVYISQYLKNLKTNFDLGGA